MVVGLRAEGWKLNEVTKLKATGISHALFPQSSHKETFAKIMKKCKKKKMVFFSSPALKTFITLRFVTFSFSDCARRIYAYHHISLRYTSGIKEILNRKKKQSTRAYIRDTDNCDETGREGSRKRYREMNMKYHFPALKLRGFLILERA